MTQESARKMMIEKYGLTPEQADEMCKVIAEGLKNGGIKIVRKKRK